MRRARYVAPREVVFLSEAMSEAIAYLGGTAKVSAVVEFLGTYYAHRMWSPKSVRNYFYMMSKPQRFTRVKRGTYRNRARIVAEIAKSLQVAYAPRKAA